jgi:hypothetical protein
VGNSTNPIPDDNNYQNTDTHAHAKAHLRQRIVFTPTNRLLRESEGESVRKTRSRSTWNFWRSSPKIKAIVT